MRYGKTKITICKDEFDLGDRASAAIAATMRELLGHQEEIRMILAAGESQITFLDALAKQSGIDWSRVVCFNMDDFWVLMFRKNSPADINSVASSMTRFDREAFTWCGSTPLMPIWKPHGLSACFVQQGRSTSFVRELEPRAIWLSTNRVKPISGYGLGESGGHHRPVQKAARE